jgi:hypothetical protein
MNWHLIATPVGALFWKVRVFWCMFTAHAEDHQASFLIRYSLSWQCEVSGSTLENFSISTPLVSSMFSFEMVSILSRAWMASSTTNHHWIAIIFFCVSPYNPYYTLLPTTRARLAYSVMFWSLSPGETHSNSSLLLLLHHTLLVQDHIFGRQSSLFIVCFPRLTQNNQNAKYFLAKGCVGHYVT